MTEVPKEEIKEENSDKTNVVETETIPEKKTNKYKLELETERQAREELQRKLEEFEEEKQISLNNYKTLWEKEKADKLRIEEERQADRKVFFNGLKQSSIEAEAAKLGIDKNCMKFLISNGFDEIEVETTSAGNVNILGAKEYVERFKKENPRLFIDGEAPNINSGGSNVPTGDKKYTPAEILKLEKDNPALYQEILKNYSKYTAK